MNNLCVYYSRTGISKKIAESIAEKIDAELCEVKLEKEYKGFFGYIGAAVLGLKKSLPEIKYETEKPLGEYDKIIFVSPVWCEDVCPAMRSFLELTKDEIKGERYFILDHMAKLSYEEKILALDRYGIKKFASYLSVQSAKHDYTDEIEQFISNI